MKLKDLIRGLDVVSFAGDEETEITDVKTDSSAVAKGSLFVCLKGENYDGKDFIGQAESYGASAIICGEDVETSLAKVIVNDVRYALSYVCAQFYGHPDEKMKIIGVTGTNGKTTTTHIIRRIFEDAGIPCGVIGTIGAFYNGEEATSSLTTPDPPELYRLLADMEKSGIKAVAMEVSAHAIYYKKVACIKFAAKVFTNFSRDHLDFFKTMDNYEKVKMDFFSGCGGVYVLNSDDKTGLKILRKSEGSVTYGIDSPADVFAIDLSETDGGLSFILNLFDCVYKVRTPLFGKFNVYNILAAATCAAVMGIKTDDIARSVNAVTSVSGRLEMVYDGDFKVFVDYAHTPDGLEKALSALKKGFKSGKIICLFGCGGNRDKLKREIMGEISAKNADFTVVTSDNPRFEEPMEIIKSVEKGIIKGGGNYIIVQDRKEAIKYALRKADEGAWWLL